MVFILLNSKLEQIRIVEEYESIIWTDRYFEAGEFELYTSADTDLLQILANNECLYMWSSISNRLMFITGYEIETVYDEGSKLVVKGRSLEYLLNRRIVWDRITFKGSLNDGIRKIINDNVINPKDSKRKIPNIYYQDSIDSRILSMTTDFDFYGDNVYEAVIDLCRRHDVGIKMINDENDHFILSLYIGNDHSYDQTENPYVIFSPSYENLGTSNFVKSINNYRNVTQIVVSKDDNGNPTRIIELNPNNSSGMDRYEMFTDAVEADKEDSYYTGKGYDDLYDHKKVIAFEGQVEATKTFVYGKDFDIGDVVQIENEYGMESKSRVTELVLNQDSNVLEIYPTFEAV